MGKTLLSVGLDVGTTTTQMILSELTVENRALGFAAPRMEITGRKILYRSPVQFTPLASENRVDGEKLRRLVEGQYQAAGITREQVDTGAVIVTGETSRKENAAAVLENLSQLAGDFVVTTAGPALESVLAARGAGADRLSRGRRVLHVDIGGGTSNLCLMEDGKVLSTGCLNVGGRLLKLDEDGRIIYRSPVLEGLTDLRPGQIPAPGQLEALAKTLCATLEMAAGKIPATQLLEKLTTRELGRSWVPPENVLLSFSGGVADCIAREYEDLAFGDLGPVLGRVIRGSTLCRGEYALGEETIRATVIGAGCYSTQLSGSTVFHQNIRFPLKNLPVLVADHRQSPEQLRHLLRESDQEQAVLFFPEKLPAGYEDLRQLARRIAPVAGTGPVLVCLEQDAAKALGQCLGRILGNTPVLCIDGLRLTQGDYLDVGAPVGPALPVVIKTLVLGGNP